MFANRDLKEDLDAMVRIEVPRKGILACNSSTAGEAIEYLKEVSLGCRSSEVLLVRSRGSGGAQAVERSQVERFSLLCFIIDF